MQIAAAVCMLVSGEALTVAAQTPRLTIAPFLAWTSSSALFEHNVYYPPPTGSTISSTSAEKLAVDAARTLGGAVSLRVVGPWVLTFAGDAGTSSYHYYNRTASSNGGASGTEMNGPMNIGSAALTLGRGWNDPRKLWQLSVGIGGLVEQLNVHHPSVCAPPPPPSSGSPASAPSCGAWQRNYSVPGALGTLSVERHLTSTWSVQLGGSYALQRADTKAFWTDLQPQYDQYEAPKSYAMHTVHVTLGIGYSR